MATLTKTHPAATTTDVEHGQNLHFFTVDYVNANASTGPEGAQQAVLRAIEDTATIACIGPLLDTNSQQTFAVEATGGNGTVVASTLQTAIRALGTVDGVDLSGATVTDTKLGILTAAVVS
jgi:hypothetical protein